MTDDDPSRCDVVETDVVPVLRRTVLPEQDERHVGATVDRHLGRTQQHPVRDRAERATHDLGLHLGILGGLDEDREVTVGRGPDDRLRQLGEVGLCQLRHDQGDHAGTPRTQTTGDGVHAVAQMVERSLHPRDRGVATELFPNVVSTYRFYYYY